MNERERGRYRLLLRLFPREFRDRWGGDMESVFAHRLASANSASERRRIWWGVLIDSLGGAAREWARTLISWDRGESVGSVRHDLRQALRGLRRTPGVAFIAITTMALGIGANTAMFSVVDRVLLEPLPYEDPDRIVAVWPAANFNTAMVRDVDEASPALQDVAGISVSTAVLSDAGDPTEIDLTRVTPSYFRILGVEPMLGRTFLDEEAVPGRTDVVVLTHELWVNRFGGDRDILGRAIRLSLDSIPTHTVIGVMPPGHQPIPIGDAWGPLLDDGASVEDDRTWYVNRRIARLAPGATMEQASEQVRTHAASVAPLVPNQFDEESVRLAGVIPLKDFMTYETSTALWGLLGAVVLVLLIACANIANLLLARGETRRSTLAVRVALGASRRSIVRLLLLEAALIGVVGGAIGICAAYLSMDLIIALAPSELPRIDQVTVDSGALAFAVAATLLAAVGSGLWPAIRSSRVHPGSELGGTSRSASGRRSSRVVSHGLVSVEMALAVIVTTGSVLMLRSLNELLTVDIGLETENVVAFRPNPLGTGRSGAVEYRSLYSELQTELLATPGVQDVGAVQVLTGGRNNWSLPTWPDGYAIPPSGGAPSVNFRAVLPGYFETLRIPVLHGRTIDARDRDGSEAVAVVNQAFVDEFWPGESGLDRTLSILSTSADPIRVVGVVGNIRQHGLTFDPRPELYVPFLDWDWEMSAWMLVRTNDPDLLKGQIREIVDRVDPAAPIWGIQDLADVFAESAASTRFFAILFTTFGLTGLVLGAIGIYGVASYSVARRRPEFGVRIALGASRSEVVRTALRTGAPPVLLGAFAGLAASAYGTEWLRGYLYRVEPTDPLSIAVVVGALGTVAISALAVPAWRAARVDPAEVLASE